jgi:hypothetical protein
MDQQTPGTLSLVQLTRLTGLSAQSIGQYVRKGVVSKIERDEYALGSVAKIVKHLQDTIKGLGQGIGVVAERREYIRERTAKARLERQALEGSLINVDIVRDAMARVRFAERAAWMALPAKVAPYVVMKATPAEAFTVLRDAVHDTLDTVGQWELGFDDEDDDDADRAKVDDGAPAGA